MGQIGAVSTTDRSFDSESLPHISTRIGLLNEGRLDLTPRGLSLDVELLGVINLRCLLPSDLTALGLTKGQPSLPGVPGVVKSRSRVNADPMRDTPFIDPDMR